MVHEKFLDMKQIQFTLSLLKFHHILKRYTGKNCIINTINQYEQACTKRKTYFNLNNKLRIAHCQYTLVLLRFMKKNIFTKILLKLHRIYFYTNTKLEYLSFLEFYLVCYLFVGETLPSNISYLQIILLVNFHNNF